MTKNMILEPSYYLTVFIDGGFNDIYFTARYRFETEEMAADFSVYADTLTNIMSDDHIDYETKRCPSIRRPRFTNLSEAIKDLSKCINCCYDYYGYYSDDDAYIYKEDIFEIQENEYLIKLLTKENEMLKNENEELKRNKY